MKLFANFSRKTSAQTRFTNNVVLDSDANFLKETQSALQQLRSLRN